MKENGDVEFTDIFNPKAHAKNRELVEARLAICNGCPKLSKVFLKCQECGCFMKLKTSLLEAKCPIGKW